MGTVPCVGIDFGTTNSCVAWVNPATGKAEVIANAEGDSKTPSLVYFGAEDTLVGAPAEEYFGDVKDLAPAERGEAAQRFVRSVKRALLDPAIPLPDGRDVAPVAVAAQILAKLRRDVEALHFREPVERAVIACPATFDALERGAIVAAAKASGFREVELVEEPVAAARAFAAEGLGVGDGILVYDLGGGTFDLAFLVRVDGDTFRVAVDTDGDAECGGDDFDLALYDFFDARLRDEFGRGVLEGADLDAFFLRECRKRKESLTHRQVAQFNPVLADGRRTRLEVDRQRFERLVAGPLEKTIRKALAMRGSAESAGFPVDTLVLIGGATRIPMIEPALRSALGLEPLRFKDQDTAVALGAAYAAFERWNRVPPPPPPPPPGGSGMKLTELEDVVAEQVCQAYLLPDPGSPGGVREPRIPSASEIVEILRRFEIPTGFYVAPAIPEAKAATARASCGVPPNERVLGLVDLTLWGSAKEALVFGEAGFYFRGTSGGAAGTVRYDEFPSVVFRCVTATEIDVGSSRVLRLVGTEFKPLAACDLLRTLRGVVATERRPRG